jgi:hypothetical protein
VLEAAPTKSAVRVAMMRITTIISISVKAALGDFLLRGIGNGQAPKSSLEKPVARRGECIEAINTKSRENWEA